MRIGHSTNGTSCEYEMQDKLKEWLKEKGLIFIDEMFIPEVSRRPDFLVFKPGNGLINIEAKCNDHSEMIKQLGDNAKYCNYSFAFIPDYSITSLETKRELEQNRFGLIIYNYQKGIITEALEAHHNFKIDRKMQKNISDRIKIELIKRKQKEYIDTQQDLFNEV